MIDLRSDAIPPSPAMRRAMAEAQIGDALFGEDASARQLGDYAARLLGMEAALFVPTCTLGNAVALLAHGCPGDRVLLDVQSHIHRREMHRPSTLSVLRPTFFDTPDGGPSIEDVRSFCTSGPPGMVCLETTHTWRRGHPIAMERLAAISAEAHQHGARIHLDAARLFYAAAALDVQPGELAANMDSLVFSLCKGIGAPVGGVLAGSAAFISAARSIQFALGGTLRMPGMLAGAGLLALQTGREGLTRDFANAQRLARALVKIGVRPEDFPTNVVLFDPSPCGLSGAQFALMAQQAGLRVFLMEPQVVRLTTHPALTDADIDEAVNILTQIVGRHSHAGTQ